MSTNKKQPTPLTRKEQRARTEEIGVVDLVQNTKGQVTMALASLLNDSGNPNTAAGMILRVNDEKDAELLRLRRELITERKKNKAIYQNVIPRLRSKAAEVRALRDKLYGRKNRRKTYEVAVANADEVSADEFERGLTVDPR